MKIKFVEEKLMKGVMLVTTLLVFLFVGSILYTVIRNGWSAMSWEMISSLPGGGFYIGKEGGLLNAIAGSLYIVGASTILGLAVSIPVVFYLNVYVVQHLLCSDHEGQKWTLDPLGLELQPIVSCHVELEIELWSCGRVASALNH